MTIIYDGSNPVIDHGFGVHELCLHGIEPAVRAKIFSVGRCLYVCPRPWRGQCEHRIYFIWNDHAFTFRVWPKIPLEFL